MLFGKKIRWAGSTLPALNLTIADVGVSLKIFIDLPGIISIGFNFLFFTKQQIAHFADSSDWEEPAHQRRRGPYFLDRRPPVLDGRELSLDWRPHITFLHAFYLFLVSGFWSVRLCCVFCVCVFFFFFLMWFRCLIYCLWDFFVRMVVLLHTHFFVFRSCSCFCYLLVMKTLWAMWCKEKGFPLFLSMDLVPSQFRSKFFFFLNFWVCVL